MSLTYIDLPTLTAQLYIDADNTFINKIGWSELISQTPSSIADSTISQQAQLQIQAYFNQAHSDWTLPLANVGTQFQQRVWQALQTIPVGETRTYSDIAEQLNSSARAVGNACRANPFIIVVPCHRVVAKNSLGGYAGEIRGNNMKIKQWLLEHEQR